MTRKNQFKLIISGASFALVAACSTGVVETEGPRALEGDAPAGTSEVYALDTAGNVHSGELTDGHFRIAIDSGDPVHVLVSGADGSLRVVSFPSSEGGVRQTAIPAHTGTIDMQALTACDCTGNGSDDELDPEINPLYSIDSDDDGQSDFEDADDDNDGTDDDSDSDADGNGVADDEEDDDRDNDGTVDEIDDDADGDGEIDDDAEESSDSESEDSTEGSDDGTDSEDPPA